MVDYINKYRMSLTGTITYDKLKFCNEFDNILETMYKSKQLTSKQYKYIKEYLKLKNISEIAAEYHITQPSVSHIISRTSKHINDTLNEV